MSGAVPETNCANTTVLCPRGKPALYSELGSTPEEAVRLSGGVGYERWPGSD